MVFDIFSRKATPSELEKIIDKAIKSASEAGTDTQPKLKTSRFHFVVVLIEDDDGEEVGAAIKQVVELMISDGAVLSSVTSSLLIGLLGVPFEKPNCLDARERLVRNLIGQLSDQIRVVHGECLGSVGLLGSRERLSWGGIIPRFSEVLKVLVELRPGTAHEFEDKT